MKDKVSTVLCISTIKLFRKGILNLGQNFNRVQSNFTLRAANRCYPRGQINPVKPPYNEGATEWKNIFAITIAT